MCERNNIMFTKHLLTFSVLSDTTCVKHLRFSMPRFTLNVAYTLSYGHTVHTMLLGLFMDCNHPVVYNT